MTHDPSSRKEGLVLSLGGFCFVRDTLFLNLMFVLRIPFQLLVSLVNFSVARRNIEPPTYKNDWFEWCENHPGALSIPFLCTRNVKLTNIFWRKPEKTELQVSFMQKKGGPLVVPSGDHTAPRMDGDDNKPWYKDPYWNHQDDSWNVSVCFAWLEGVLKLVLMRFLFGHLRMEALIQVWWVSPKLGRWEDISLRDPLKPLGFQTRGEDVFGQIFGDTKPYLKHRTSAGIWKTRVMSFLFTFQICK